MQKTCLIAAHDPWFIQLLRIYSEESGLHVVQAYEGQEVIPLVHSEHPDAILLQADLPGQVKVVDLLHALKDEPESKDIPVLLFSWVNGETLGDLTGTASVYLQEPVTYETFVDALKKAHISC